ncbi:MAG: TonB-dependent receptor plug domain-containing protein [Bacteroidales bacterium]|nr:TonB-dependent receptor plug domain-containing protein [Bacteroidales bacterium]MBN2821525.1 TonB-dependent receptor plug domain-containing protein [Bacteroidales bacterium]
MIKYIFIAGLLLAATSIYCQNVLFKNDSTATLEASIGEVIIAASKDNSELKKLPTSTDLISSFLIKSNEIRSLTEISGLASNFVMPDYGSKLTSPVYIRGIGSRINSPSVGLYVDGIPYFEKAAFNFDFFDVDKVEVLKGPQGTLYGRNSMGGVINVITKTPMNSQGTNAGISIGTYGNYKFNAGHYNKFTDNFAFSISANYQHNDGFYTNRFLNNKVDASDSYGFRNRLIYIISESLTIENIANLEHSQQGGYPYAVYNDSLNKTEDVYYNQASSYARTILSDGLILRLSKDNWELTNTLSYQLLDDVQKIDQDFTEDSLYFVDQQMKQNMFSNEIIVRSKENKKYNWLFGGFGFKQFFDKSVTVDAYASNMWYLKNYDLEVSSFALFHQSMFNLSEQLKLTAGARYDKEIALLDYRYNLEISGNPATNTDTVYPKLTDHVLLPKLSLSYEFKNSTLYGSYTTGYKPGGFNSSFEKPEHLAFKHENSRNYELGYKASFLNGILYSDLAIFYTQLKNQQIYRTVPSGRGSYLDNAGVSENKGFEISTKTNSFSGFSAMVSYGYTHSEILEYEEDSARIYNNNFSPYIPRNTFAIQLNYSVFLKQISFIDKVACNITFNQQGELYWNLENNYKEERYGLLNAKISFIRKSIQLDFWGRNLTNTDYNSFLFEALGNTYAQTRKPLHLGMNFSINF